VFLDTNVLVSAFASRGLCADLFETVLLEHDFLVGRNVIPAQAVWRAAGGSRDDGPGVEGANDAAVRDRQA
jgi:hypothetical protein